MYSLPLKRIIDDVVSLDTKKRHEGIMAIKNFECEELSDEDYSRLFKKLASIEDIGEFYDDDPSVALLQFASRFENDAFLPLVVQHFDFFTPVGKGESFSLLSLNPCKENIRIMCELIDTIKEETEIDFFNLNNIHNPRMKVVVISLLDKITNMDLIEPTIYYIYQSLCEKTLSPIDLKLHLNTFVKIASNYRLELTKDQNNLSNDLIFETDYIEMREALSVTLEILSFFKEQRIELFLKSFMSFNDPWILDHAAIALLKIGAEPSKEIIYKIVNAPERRNYFYESLEELNSLHLFPEEYLNQDSFTKGIFCSYLSHQYKLKFTPNDISVADSFVKGNQKYQLVKFSLQNEPHNKYGAMVALVGPIEINGFTTQTFCETKYLPWRAFSPKDHFEDLFKHLENE